MFIKTIKLSLHDIEHNKCEYIYDEILELDNKLVLLSILDI